MAKNLLYSALDNNSWASDAPLSPNGEYVFGRHPSNNDFPWIGRHVDASTSAPSYSYPPTNTPPYGNGRFSTKYAVDASFRVGTGHVMIASVKDAVDKLALYYCAVGQNTWRPLIIIPVTDIFGAGFESFHNISFCPGGEYFWCSGNINTPVNADPNLYLCKIDYTNSTITMVDTFAVPSGGVHNTVLSPNGKFMAVFYGTPSCRIYELNATFGVVRSWDLSGNGSFGYGVWHPNSIIFVRRYNTTTRVAHAKFTGSTWSQTLSDFPSAVNFFGFMHYGRTLVGIPTSNAALVLRDFNPDTNTMGAYTGTAFGTTLGFSPFLVNTTSRKVNWQAALGNKFLIPSSATTTKRFVMSDGPYLQMDVTAPKARLAGTLAKPIDATIAMNAPRPIKFNGLAQRDEYIIMEAAVPAASFEASMDNYYSILEALAPSFPEFDSTAVILDEPFIPFEVKFPINTGAYAGKSEEAPTITSEPAPPYFLGEFNSFMPTMDIIGFPPYFVGEFDSFVPLADIEVFRDTNFDGEFVAPFPDFDAIMGVVPKFEGDFEATPAVFDADANVTTAVYLEAFAPSAEFEGEGLLPSDVLIVEAYSFLPLVDAETYQAPAGMLEAVAPVAELDGYAEVPYVAWMELTAPSVSFDAFVNVPFEVTLEPVASLPTFDGYVDVPFVSTLDMSSYLPNTDIFVGIASAGELDANAPVAESAIDVTVPFAVFLEAFAPAAEFEGLPPPPYEVTGDFVSPKAQMDIFGGPWLQVYLDAVAPEAEADIFGGRMETAALDAVAPLSISEIQVAHQYLSMDAISAAAQFEGVAHVIHQASLDAISGVPDMEIIAHVIHQARLEAITAPAQFEALPPDPYTVTGEFVVNSIAEADIFGGPWILTNLEAVAPKAQLDILLLKAGQLDANLRSPKALFDALANIQVSGNLEGIAPSPSFDAYVTQEVEAELDVTVGAPTLNITIRFGAPGDGEAYTLTYRKRRNPGKAFSPLHVRF